MNHNGGVIIEVCRIIAIGILGVVDLGCAGLAISAALQPGRHTPDEHRGKAILVFGILALGVTAILATIIVNFAINLP